MRCRRPWSIARFFAVAMSHAPITMTFIALFSLVWGYFARTTWVAWSVETCSVHW